MSAGSPGGQPTSKPPQGTGLWLPTELQGAAFHLSAAENDISMGAAVHLPAPGVRPRRWVLPRHRGVRARGPTECSRASSHVTSCVPHRVGALMSPLTVWGTKAGELGHKAKETGC